MDKDEAIKSAIEFFEQRDDSVASYWTFAPATREQIVRGLRDALAPEEPAIKLLREINFCREARLPQELWNRVDEFLAVLPPQVERS